MAAGAGKERLARAREARLRDLMQVHADLVSRALRCYGVREAELDDALQMVFMVLARRLGDVEVGRERAFLMATAHRIAFRMRRTRQRRREAAAPNQESLASTDSPEKNSEQKQAFEIMTQVLDSMPEELSHVFLLFEIEECSTLEIARALGIPKGTVASRLRRARAVFQTKVRTLQHPARALGDARRDSRGALARQSEQEVG